MSKSCNVAAEVGEHVVQGCLIPAGDGEEQTIRVLCCRRRVF